MWFTEASFRTVAVHFPYPCQSSYKENTKALNLRWTSWREVSAQCFGFFFEHHVHDYRRVVHVRPWRRSFCTPSQRQTGCCFLDSLRTRTERRNWLWRRSTTSPHIPGKVLDPGVDCSALLRTTTCPLLTLWDIFLFSFFLIFPPRPPSLNTQHSAPAHPPPEMRQMALRRPVSVSSISMGSSWLAKVNTKSVSGPKPALCICVRFRVSPSEKVIVSWSGVYLVQMRRIW